MSFEGANDMSEQILSAIIEASGVVIASVIASFGVFLILRHRQNIASLTRAVEPYHQIEGPLVEELLKRQGQDVTPSLISAWRGKFRTQLLADREALMLPRDAVRIRRSYFSAD